MGAPRNRWLDESIPSDWDCLELRKCLADNAAGDWGEDEGEKQLEVIRSTNFTSRLLLDLGLVAKRFFPSTSGVATLEKDDIVVERSGGGPTQPVGRIAFVGDREFGYGYSNFIQRLRVDRNEMDPQYLAWCLYRLHETGLITRFQHQTTQMRNLDLRSYLRLAIPRPALNEQQAISNLLAMGESARDALQKKLDALRQLRTARMSALLRDRDLMDQDYPLQLSALPSSWRKAKVGALVTYRQLGTGEVADSGSRDIPILKMGDMRWGRLDLSKVEFVAAARSYLLDEYSLEDRDFLFNTRNTPALVGKTAIWHGEFHQAVFNNNILRLRFDEEVVDPEYLNLEFSSFRGRRRLRGLAVGTTSVAAIYWDNLRRFEVPLPPKEVQLRVVQIAAAFENAIYSLAHSVSQIEVLEHALRQNLVGGRTRLRVFA